MDYSGRDETHPHRLPAFSLAAPVTLSSPSSPAIPALLSRARRPASLHLLHRRSLLSQRPPRLLRCPSAALPSQRSDLQTSSVLPLHPANLPTHQYKLRHCHAQYAQIKRRSLCHCVCAPIFALRESGGDAAQGVFHYATDFTSNPTYCAHLAFTAHLLQNARLHLRPHLT
jgi:hypothetical protein